MKFINTVSGIYGLANIAIKASGGKGLRFWKDAGYYPSQWGHTANMTQQKININGFFFDAVFSVDTDHGLTVTQHPVQTGANISDHAYINPVRISMTIGMSDVMAYRYPGAYGNAGYTKSVSAYRKLCELQELRIPLRVLTRLNSYENMLIESITVNDDVSTLYGLRATVQLLQVLVANVGTEKVSARGWTTSGATKNNEVQPAADDRTILRNIEDAGGILR